MRLKQLPNEPAIVLLHGFPFDRSMWREQIDFLSANGFRAIAPDLRGLGENRFDGEIATVEDMAHDVAALMDDSEIDQAVVCGLSMGSYVAFEFVRLFPARVRALVLAGARAQGADDAERKSREDKAQDVLNDGIGPFVEAMLADLLAPKTLAEKPAVVARVREMILRTDPRGAAAAQRGMAARRDYSGDLSDMNVAALIIAGREDLIRKPDDAELIHRGITKSVLAVIDDAGHLMNMEQPEVFNGLVVDFLRLMH
jgi:pimeloyl-ACP methyl ester carboxylesterase